MNKYLLKVICNNCTIILHKGHKFEPILKASKTYVKMVRSSLERTKPLTTYASDTISRLNIFSKKINERADTVNV